MDLAPSLEQTFDEQILELNLEDLPKLDSIELQELGKPETPTDNEGKGQSPRSRCNKAKRPSQNEEKESPANKHQTKSISKIEKVELFISPNERLWLELTRLKKNPPTSMELNSAVGKQKRIKKAKKKNPQYDDEQLDDWDKLCIKFYNKGIRQPENYGFTIDEMQRRIAKSKESSISNKTNQKDEIDSSGLQEHNPLCKVETIVDCASKTCSGQDSINQKETNAPTDQQLRDAMAKRKRIRNAKKKNPEYNAEICNDWDKMCSQVYSRKRRQPKISVLNTNEIPSRLAAFGELPPSKKGTKRKETTSTLHAQRNNPSSHETMMYSKAKNLESFVSYSETKSTLLEGATSNEPLKPEIANDIPNLSDHEIQTESLQDSVDRVGKLSVRSGQMIQSDSDSISSTSNQTADFESFLNDTNFEGLDLLPLQGMTVAQKPAVHSSYSPGGEPSIDTQKRKAKKRKVIKMP